MQLIDLAPVQQVTAAFGRRNFAASSPFTKTLRVMKLTAFIILGFCLQLSARTHSQTVTFSGKNVTLETVLTSVKEQTGYNVLFDLFTIEHAKPITIEADKLPLNDFLNNLFKDQPLAYTLKSNSIIITQKKTPAGHLSNPLLSTLPPITGIVRGPDGQPMAGVNVQVKGTNNGVVTDNNGRFSIDAEEGSTIVVSNVGFSTREIKANGNNDIFVVDLAINTNPLDEVQIIAYGQTTRRLNTGNTATVTAKDIEKQPVSNPLLALQGRVPGLVITQATGVNGSAVTVRIQGNNSIGQGNEPFYVVDGVPFSSQMTPNGGYIGVILGKASGVPSYGSPLSYLNPNDIESIDVLKDADATAIYGSRAANGAIIITTKKGKQGETKIDINAQQGWARIPHNVALLNTPQYLEMRHEALKNDGIPVGDADYDINGTWDTTRYTDWQKELLGGTAQYTDIHASVFGGTANCTYLIGGTYHRETTIFPDNFSDQKGTFHFSVNSASRNKRFKIDFSGSLLSDDNRLPGFDLVSSALTLPPNAPSLYNPDGSLNWAPDQAGNTTWFNSINPIGYLLNSYSVKGKNVVANSLISYELLPNLEIKGNLGYTDLKTTERAINPQTSIAPELRPFLPRSAFFGDYDITSWIVEPQLSYNISTKFGKVDALAGSTINQKTNTGQTIDASGFSSDALLENLRAAPTITIGASTANVYKYTALFGRLNYNWQDKYIINVTTRRDGSSRFGSENQFHNFGAIGTAWILTNERFLQSKAKVISFAKLKASYGTTGNDQIGDYQFLSLYNPITVGVPYQNVTGFRVNRLSNPYLQWELTKKLQLGVDLGLLNDRIFISTTYFRNRSSNQLLSYTLPIITGFTTVARNFPATVENAGWEISLATDILNKRSFSWSANFNLTLAENKLVSFPNLETSTYASGLIIGQPTTISKVVQLSGVNPLTGVYEFKDKNGNATTTPDPSSDNLTVINTVPRVYGGLSNRFTYKGFQISVFLQFVKQKSLNNYYGYYPGIANSNQPVSVLDRWKKVGDEASIQKFSTAFDNGFMYDYQNGIDASYSDASFVRIKNISISWDLPRSWIRNKFRSLQIYAHGQNVFTITRFKGLDPETGWALPPLRVVSVGTKLSL